MKRPPRELVTRLVAEASVLAGCDPADVFPVQRKYGPLVWVRRRVAQELIARPERWTLHSIGIALGGLDHTTVMHYRDTRLTKEPPIWVRGAAKPPKCQMALPPPPAAKMPPSELTQPSRAQLMAGHT